MSVPKKRIKSVSSIASFIENIKISLLELACPLQYQSRELFSESFVTLSRQIKILCIFNNYSWEILSFYSIRLEKYNENSIFDFYSWNLRYTFVVDMSTLCFPNINICIFGLCTKAIAMNTSCCWHK